MLDDAGRTAIWKQMVAAILDVVTVFIVGGYVIGFLTGGLIGNGFSLDGSRARWLGAILVVYFVVGRGAAGCTLWDRIFRIKRPQPD